MRLFSSGKNLIEPLWRYSQNGNLWRIYPVNSRTLIGETRDLNLKKVYFFSINIETGKTNFSNMMFEDGNYWVSIEGFNSKMFFLHRFENPNLPDHKSIIAIDNFTGKVIWENPDVIYYFNTEEKLYGYKQKFESFEYLIISETDGRTAEIIPESEHKALYNLKNEISENKYSDNIYTESFRENENTKLRDIIHQEISNVNFQGNIEFIVKDNYLCFNYLTEKQQTGEGRYENIFCIYLKDKKKRVFREIIDARANYNVPDSFFINGNNLFFIKEKKEVAAIHLI